MGQYKLNPDQETQDDIQKVLLEISKVVNQSTGIQLGEKQFSMVENRLKSHMIKMGINLFSDYLTYFNAHKIAETEKLVSLMTTHHTYFFREFTHFEYLESHLAEIAQRVRDRGDNKITVWSAACSRGQEVYSLALFLDIHLKQIAPDIGYEILGTDIDPESVKMAKNGVYPWDDVKKIPMQYLNGHWVRGTGDIASFAKIKDNFKKNCSFDVVNLNDIKPLNKKFDVIFCRNVFIYFNLDQIKNITKSLISYLKPEGLFFVGISETLNGVAENINYVGPSVYTEKMKVVAPVPQPATSKFASKSTATATASSAASKVPPAIVKAPLFQMPSVLKVLCVDDSQTILTLLKKILTKEFGFEVIGTAIHGKDAVEKMKTLKPDLVTLDIHMPEMDGISYLKSQMNDKHPPVIMISSINRENSDTAMKSIELGASDYIEKPTMANLQERSDEIRSKLKMAYQFKHKSHKLSEIDKSFKKKYEIKNTDKKARVVFANLSASASKLTMEFVKNILATDPATLFVFDGVFEALPPLFEKMKSKTSLPMILVDEISKIEDRKVYFCDLEKNSKKWNELLKDKKVSVAVMGMPSKKILTAIQDIHPAHLTVEDVGDVSNPHYQELKEVAQAIVPLNSYLSVSEDFFVKSDEP